MSFGDYLQGSIELVVVAAGMAYAAVALRRRLLPGWSGPSARLTEVVLGLSLLVVTAELVGVVGLYRPGWESGWRSARHARASPCRPPR
jgi:hypothetical protein